MRPHIQVPGHVQTGDADVFQAAFHLGAGMVVEDVDPAMLAVDRLDCCIGLAVAFFAGVPVAKAALIGGAILLLTRAIKPERIYREIDGPLLFMFAGLFVVVAGAERRC